MADAKPSKSAKKREYLSLQDLGEKLILLSREKLAGIDTDPYLIEQILQAKSIKSHSALRRQKQLIGKIMREVDPEPIELALARLGQGGQLAKAIFKEAEVWRDRIAAGGLTALQEFMSHADQGSANLAAHIKDHDGAADSAQRRQIRRKMFREIHAILLLVQEQNDVDGIAGTPESDEEFSDSVLVSKGD